MNPLEQLIQGVKEGVGADDPERLALAVRVATDYALLQAQASSGTINVSQLDHELKIVEASARNLDDATRQVITVVVMKWTQATLARALGIPTP